MISRAEPLHLHIDNSTALGSVFDITRERFDAAAARHPQIAEQLHVTFGQDGEGFDAAMKSASVLFGWNFERGNLVETAPQLRWVQIQGAGINHLLPLDWLPKGVTLTNSSGAHGHRASEYLIMAVLALNSGLPAMMTAQRERRWAQINTSAIGGKTLLIFGVGAVGGSLANEAKKFDLKVIGVRKSGKPHPDVDEMHTPDKLRALLPGADFIAITAPQTPDTERAFGRSEFALCKEGAGLISYSRSRLVDYEAMCERLNKNKMSAVVDVFDVEPLESTSVLWHTPNLIVTPHSSSNDPIQHAERSLDLLFDNLSRFLNNEPLMNMIDPVQQY